MAGQNPTVPTTPQAPATPQYGSANQLMNALGISTGGLMQMPGTVPIGGNFQAKSATDVMKEIMEAIGPDKTPGANVPYTTKPTVDPQTGLAPGTRMPMAPSPFQEMPTRQAPLENTSQARESAQRSNLSNAMGNIVGKINARMEQQKYQNKVDTIKDFQNAVVQYQNGEKVQNTPGIDPQSKAEAAKVMQDAMNVIQKIKGDNKQWKIIQDSMPNYLKPEENNTPEVRAGQQANQEVAANIVAGRNDDNAGQARVSQLANNITMAGKGPMGTQQQMPGVGAPASGPVKQWSPPARLPEQLAENPAYQAAQARREKIEDAVMKTVYPGVLRAGAQAYSADTRAQGQLESAQTKATADLKKAGINVLGKAYETDTKAKAAYDRVTEANVGKVNAALANKGWLDTGVAGNPQMAPLAPMMALGQAKNLQADITKMTTDNRTLQQDIDMKEKLLGADPSTYDPNKPKQPLKQMAGGPGPEGDRRREIEGQIRDAKAQIASNNETIKQLDGIRTEITRKYAAGFEDAQGGSTTGGGQPKAGATPAFKNQLTPEQLAPLVEYNSQQFGLDKNLLASVVEIESRRDAGAISPTGAQGLMQLVPSTGEAWAKKAGVAYDPYNPNQNMQLGSMYLKSLLQRYGGNMRLALTAYNVGEGNLDKAGRDPSKLPTSYTLPGGKIINLRQAASEYVGDVMRDYAKRTKSTQQASGAGATPGKPSAGASAPTAGPNTDAIDMPSL